MKRNCLICGTEFYAKPGVVARGQGKYCSKECTNVSQIKEPVTCTCAFCGDSFNVHPSRVKYGRGVFCGRKCMYDYASVYRVGENANVPPKGNRQKDRMERDGRPYREWREAVFARDNWTCQDCGVRGGRLNAHHVFPFAQFPEHRLEIWNGVTLCNECHWNTHRRGPSGQALETKQQTVSDGDNASL